MLVVDDQLTMRALIRSALQEIGFRDIADAGDGEEGLKSLLAAAGAAGDLRFQHAQAGWPRFSARRACAPKPLKKSAFIMLTGRADKELVQRAMQFGVNNYITKPFSPAQLRQKIQEVFGPLT